LWVRHQGNLSPHEKANITRDMQSESEEHEKTISH